MAAAKDISLDAAAVADLSELEGTFANKEEQRMALKASFSMEKMFFLYLNSIRLKKADDFTYESTWIFMLTSLSSQSQRNLTNDADAPHVKSKCNLVALPNK